MCRDARAQKRRRRTHSVKSWPSHISASRHTNRQPSSTCRSCKSHSAVDFAYSTATIWRASHQVLHRCKAMASGGLRRDCTVRQHCAQPPHLQGVEVDIVDDRLQLRLCELLPSQRTQTRFLHVHKIGNSAGVGGSDVARAMLLHMVGAARRSAACTAWRWPCNTWCTRRAAGGFSLAVISFLTQH